MVCCASGLGARTSRRRGLVMLFGAFRASWALRGGCIVRCARTFVESGGMDDGGEVGQLCMYVGGGAG